LKPKENTISKINLLFKKIYATESLNKIDDDSAEILKRLDSHVNTMNLHHAKVAYFSSVKLELTHILELLNSDSAEEFHKSVNELKKFL